MACEAWFEDLVEVLSGEIGEERAIRLEQHLAECRACTEELRRLERIVEVTRSREAWTPDSRLEERLIGALRGRHVARASGSWWAVLWQRRVPAYAIVGVALLGVMIGTRLDRPLPPSQGTTVVPERTPTPAVAGGTLQASLPEIEFATTPSDAIRTGRLGSPDSL